MKNRNPHRNIILSAGPKLAISAFSALVISLLAFYFGIPLLVKTLILKETRLVEGTETWQKWTDVTLPIFIKFYIFNVTNIEEAEKGGKFKLQEVGPYVWEEKRTKIILSVDEKEDTVNYKEVIRYYFRRDLSVGSDDDRLHIVNMPFIAASTLIYQLLYSSLANYAIDFFIQMGENFVMRDVKVRELAFDGVELGDNYKVLAELGIAELPEEFIDGTFAFYNQKNGTPSKEYKVSRGVKNSEDFGKILEFDHSNEVSWWTDSNLKDQYCNKINGSDGSLYAPFVTPGKVLRAFSPDVCRSVYMQFNEEVNFHGIPAYHYGPPDETFQSVIKNPDNQCFCTDPGHGLDNYCDVSGVIRMFSCKKGIPLIFSLPHYLQADQRFLDEVEGMNPDPEKHTMKMILEPNSGAVLQLIKRIQVGVEFQRLSEIEAFRDIYETVVPILWIEERVDNDEKGISELRNRLVTPMEILKILKPTTIGLFSFLFFLGVLLTYKKNSEQSPLIPYGTDYQ